MPHTAGSSAPRRGRSVWVRRVFGVLAALALAAPAAAGAATVPGLAVVLAIDVSASVDADTFVLERDGIADAFASRQLAAAVASVPGGIAALLFEWSDPDADAVAVQWRHIEDAGDAAAFAAAVHAAPRLSHGRTAIASALLAAAREFDRLPRGAARRMIDISGNGIANLGLAPAAARDRLVGAGITINGLAVLDQDPWLADYYRDNVIGGAGAFVLAAESDRSFVGAMLRKLVAEVAGARGAGVVVSKFAPLPISRFERASKSKPH